MWYIFPQPYQPKRNSITSKTSKFFYISDAETKLFLEDRYLSKSLDGLASLETKNLDSAQLKEYFSPNGDNKEFKSFRNHFKKVIKDMKPEEGTPQGEIIIKIRERLNTLQIE